MTDVYATDFSGQEIDVEVDKSQVNTSQPGSYIVYYKAVDSYGNETIEEVTFTLSIPLPIKVCSLLKRRHRKLK